MGNTSASAWSSHPMISSLLVSRLSLLRSLGIGALAAFSLLPAVAAAQDGAAFGAAGYALADDWAVSRRAHARGDRRSEPAERVLHWPGGRRSVEEQRLRTHMEPDLRWTADAVDWRHCRGAVESEYCVRGQRGRTAPARSFGGRWDLQVDRCGQDVGAPGTSCGRADSGIGRGPARSEQAVCVGAGASVWTE